MADMILSARASGSGYERLNKTIIDVYSKEILLEALPLFIFDQFALQKEELMKSPGLTVNFLNYTDMGGGGKLSESETIPSNKYGESLTPITVYEYGNSMIVSELLMKTSFDDVMANVKLMLGRNYKKIIDTDLRDVVLRTDNIAYAPNYLTKAKVSSRATLTEDCVFGSAVIKDVVEYMDTTNVPRFNEEFLVGFIHPHQERTLSDDRHWIEANEYAQTKALFTGEIGTLHGVRFIKTTQMPSIATGVAGTTATANWDGTVYQAGIVGTNGFGHAKSLQVELRDGGVIDFDRKHALAWYSIEGFDKVKGDSMVLVETA